MPRPAWELALRVRMGCPRYFTANEGASELLRAGAAALIAGWCIWACGPPLLAWAALVGSYCSAVMHEADMVAVLEAEDAGTVEKRNMAGVAASGGGGGGGSGCCLVM